VIRHVPCVGREAGHSGYNFMPIPPCNRIIEQLGLLAAGLYACSTVRFVLVVRFVASASFRERCAAIKPEDLLYALPANYYYTGRCSTKVYS
jgi:hypothetical protein